MYLPDKIINAFTMMPAEDCGALFKITIEYLTTGEEPATDSLSPAAQAVFALAKIILAPRIKRKKAKLAKAAETANPSEPAIVHEPTEITNLANLANLANPKANPIPEEPDEPRLPRAERRRREKELRKLQKRLSRRGQTLPVKLPGRARQPFLWPRRQTLLPDC